MPNMEFLLALMFGVLIFTNAYPQDFPNPEGCTNCHGRVHSPSVVYNPDSKLFYRFTANDRISIAAAKHMSGPWTYLGPALPNGSIIDLPGNQDLWAPDVVYINGTYYMYYSVSTLGSQLSDIGVASSETMEASSWHDHGSIGLPWNDAQWNKIDSNVLQPTSWHTQPEPLPLLLAFGSFHQNIFQAQMTSPLAVDAGARIVQLEHNGTAPSPVEAAFQFQWGDYFYLFFSSGRCCNAPPQLVGNMDENKIMACRSRTATGGFVDLYGRDCLHGDGGNLVMSSHDDIYAPGGQGVLFDPVQKRTVLYYHYVRKSVGYGYDEFFFGWNFLDFASDGWPVVVEEGMKKGEDDFDSDLGNNIKGELGDGGWWGRPMASSLGL